MNLRSACLLVVQKGDHSLGYFEPKSGRELARVPLDPYPHEFALSGDRRLAYMCHFGVALAEDPGPGGNTVSVVDIARRTRVGTLNCGPDRRPHGIDLDARGRVYVLSEASSRLLCFDGAENPDPVTRVPTGGDGSHFVTVTRDGRRAYCSNMGSDTVTAISPDGIAEPVAIPVGIRPEGSVLSADESRLYVTNRESASISVIDTGTLTVLTSIDTAPGPVRVCRDPAGRLLVALYHGRGLAVIDPTRPDDQARLTLPDRAVSISHDDPAGCAMLSILGDQVCVVDLTSLSLTHCIATRADPDPTALVRRVS